MTSQKKIIFMGTPEISSVYLDFLIKEKYNIIAVYSQPPRKKGRGLLFQESSVHKMAILNNIDIYTPINFHDKKTINDIEALNPDLIIVMGYGLKLPNYILNLPLLGCINIHVSLLPRWRGASPIEHSLLNGDSKTGVTIFKLVEEMDAGPIISYKSIKLDKDINKDNLVVKLNLLGKKLLKSTLPNIINKKIDYQDQNLNLVTYAPKISNDLKKLDFNKKINIIQNKIRAFSAKPSAWFLYNNERIKIIKSYSVKGDFKCSEIINNKFHIGCQDGKICPLIIQREGRKSMDLNSFLRGFQFKIGDKIYG